MKLIATILGLLLPAWAQQEAGAAADIVVADFEGETYGAWTAMGTAFGSGPARGTLPGQMAVSGYQGEGLVNSFLNGDGSTGTLTSPAIRIERPWINFLIGGGGYHGETCINLLVDGKAVRSATGTNERSGGSEQLNWRSWDVREFVGQEAVFQIVDARTGGWGHINVDQILQSDNKRELGPATRRMHIAKRYLHLPVKTGARKQRMELRDGKTVVRAMDVELAGPDADFVTFLDVSAWQGRDLTVHVDAVADGSTLLSHITQSDELPRADEMYDEAARPQFHFTSRRGWLNDPNGLVYFRGEWHLFYQHNPYGWNWGNMHWGHAVSPDLVHWRELGDAIFPWSDARGAVFSGSAVIDVNNTAGFQRGAEPALIAAFTDTEAGESLAYSNDRGRSFEMYRGNPVVQHRGRDPKILWHEPTERWVMAVYDETDRDQAIAFYTSADLKHWELAGRITGFYECPDLFELSVDGKADQSKWVLFAADGKYVLGDFDGRTFVPEHAGKHELWHGNFYAAQTYSNVPEGRRVLIGWGRGIEFPGMPFNQQMTLPMELNLRSTAAGTRMFAEPVQELVQLRAELVQLPKRAIDDASVQVDGLQGELLEVLAEFELGTAAEVGLSVRGQRVAFSREGNRLSCGDVSATLVPSENRVRLHVLVDRGSVEVFGNHGAVVLSVATRRIPEERTVEAFAKGGTATLRRLQGYPLRSAWGE